MRSLFDVITTGTQDAKGKRQVKVDLWIDAANVLFKTGGNRRVGRLRITTSCLDADGKSLSADWKIVDLRLAAQAHFPGKRVEALIAMVGCESCNMQDRNHAVWTLGQLDDPRALPVLQKYYTGAKYDHLKNLCQGTLQIALRHLRHEDNNRFESVLWRWMLPAEN